MISELNGETRQRRGTGTRHAETRFTLTLSSCFRACFSGFVYGLSLFPSISVLTLCFKPLADDIRTSPDQLPTSNSILWYALCTPLPFIGGPFEFFDKERNYLDVRDATEAHARALEIEEAGGQRFILAAGMNFHEPYSIPPLSQSCVHELISPKVLLIGMSGVSVF